MRILNFFFLIILQLWVICLTFFLFLGQKRNGVRVKDGIMSSQRPPPGHTHRPPYRGAATHADHPVRIDPHERRSVQQEPDFRPRHLPRLREPACVTPGE